MNRRSLLVGTGAVLSLTAFGNACGGAFVTQRDLPPLGGRSNGAPPVVTALRYGITAPSAHNTQPWRFEIVSTHEARLYTDPTRLLPLTDPPARQVLISHGTLLETVAIASTALGYRARIEVLPDGELSPNAFGSKPTASIRLERDVNISRDPLFEAIGLRRTSRLEHVGDPPTPGEIRTVVDATAGTGAMAEVRVQALDPLLDIIRQAMAVEVHDTKLYRETKTWFRFSAEEVARHRDGLNLETSGSDTFLAKLFLNESNFLSESNRARFLEKFNAVVDTTRSLFVLTTAENGVRDWIAAGRAYVRAQLAAGSIDLRMHPVSQVLQEYSPMDALRGRFGGILPVASPGKMQMLVRLGRTDTPAISPRRKLTDMLTTPEATDV